MEKKTGNECTAKEPAAPTEATEAADSEPGEVSTSTPKTSNPKSGTLGSKTVSGIQSPEEEAALADETHWVSIDLKDEHGSPIPNEQYRVKLPDGSIRSGYTDSEGKAKVDGLPEGGQAEINFPRIHGDEWTPA